VQMGGALQALGAFLVSFSSFGWHVCFCRGEGVWFYFAIFI
jgi:hypothetical protein